MASQDQAATYKKRPGCATTHGQDFEMYWAALLFLRGLNSGQHFQLASNLEGAGAIDDLVFRCKREGESDWTTLFVQLKHKENAAVTRNSLFNQKSSFKVANYFESYLEIKKVMSVAERDTMFEGCIEKCHFVVFTNAKANVSVRKGNCNLESEHVRKFLWSNLGSVLSFEDDSEVLESLNGSDDDRIDFLSRFLLFCGQPKGDGLIAEIKSELREAVAGKLQGNLASVLVGFLGRVKDWWAKSNEILSQDHDILSVSIMDTISSLTVDRYKIPYEFTEAGLESVKVAVNGDNTFVCLETNDGSTRFSFTKLWQAFVRKPLVLTWRQLLDNKRALTSLSRRKNVTLLVISTDDGVFEKPEGCFEIVKEMRDSPKTPSILFLSCRGNPWLKALREEFGESCQNVKDQFMFTHLTEVCQEKLLATKLNLQGDNITLGTLLSNTNDFEKVLDASCVNEIVESRDEIQIGSPMEESIGYYVDRSLEEACVVKSNFLKGDSFRGTVRVQIVENESSADSEGLFGSALCFLSSKHTSPKAFNTDHASQFKSLGQSPLVLQKGSVALYIGPSVQVALYDCKCIKLRQGQDDPVTALLVTPIKESANKASIVFVSDEINDADLGELSKFNKSRHVLSLKDNELRLVQSQGGIDSVRHHLDESKLTQFAPKTAMDVADRLVLICAEPGMGKSTLMIRLAKTTKERFPHYFVILIALNDHSQLFAEKKHKNALGFLSSACKVESPLEGALLRHALTVSGDVVVLIDGYDEISPKYGEQCCELLASIQQTKATKIWMTSRNSIKRDLERKVGKFSAKLCRFEEKDQKEFLKKFWAGKPHKNLDGFIDDLLEKTSRAVRDKDKNFMGIPLQTRMLAEVYEDHVSGSSEKSQLPDNMDILQLLEEFVEKKYGIFVHEKFSIPKLHANFELLCELLRDIYINNHATAALILILGDNENKTLCLTSANKTLTHSSFEKLLREDKSGFIVEVDENTRKTRFIHRVFAEYFAAFWFSKHFEDSAEELIGTSQLIKANLYEPDFAVVRNMFDRILARGFVLHTAVLNEHLEEVRVLVEGADLEVQDGGGRTALHLAAALGRSDDQGDNRKREEILDVILAASKGKDFEQVDNIFQGTPLLYADRARWWSAIDKLLKIHDHTNPEGQLCSTLEDVTNHDMLEAIFELDMANLLAFCLDKGLAVEHCSKDRDRLLLRACAKGCLKLAILLINKGAKIHDDDDESPMSTASAYGHLEIIKYLLSTIETPGQQELGNLFRDNEVNKAVSQAARNGRAHVLSFFIDKGCDPKNIDLLFLAADSKSFETTKVLVEAVDEADRVGFVNVTNQLKDCPVHVASKVGSLEIVTLLVETGGRLHQMNRDGETPLMTASRLGSQDIVEFLVESFNAEKESISKEHYINIQNKFGTAMHLAAWYNFPGIVKYLISRGGDTRIRNEIGKSPLHVACCYKCHEVVKVLLDAVSEDLTAVANECDQSESSVLYFAAFGGSLECVELVVQAGGKLSAVNRDLRTPLMAAASEGNHDALGCLLEMFDSSQEGLTKLEYINMKDKAGKTALDLADSVKCRRLMKMTIRNLVALLDERKASTTEMASDSHVAAER